MYLHCFLEFIVFYWSNTILCVNFLVLKRNMRRTDRQRGKEKKCMGRAPYVSHRRPLLFYVFIYSSIYLFIYLTIFFIHVIILLFLLF